MFPWVPDGTYDSRDLFVRYIIVDGMPKIIMHKMWVDQGGPEDVPLELRQPWETFPDFPPKPEKKV